MAAWLAELAQRPTPKTLATEVGDIVLDTPRDRAGTFEPRLVPRGTRRAGGLDDILVALYAGGMTVRDIQHHLARTLGTELSHRRSPTSPMRCWRRSRWW